MSASPVTGRRLSRSTMKKEQQPLEPMMSMGTEAKSNEQDEFSSCEITTICNQSKINKKLVMPFPKTENISENMPNILSSSGDPSKAASVRKRSIDKTSKSQQFSSIGLSDLGTNSQISLPSRPRTTGRLLPHIGHKHLQKDSASIGTRPAATFSCSSAIGARKTGHVIKTNVDSHSHELKKTEQDKNANFGAPHSSLSTLSIKTGYEDSGCLLNPSSLHSFVGSKLTPTPPSRKPIRISSGGGGVGVCTHESSKPSPNEPQFAKSIAPGNNKVIPSSEFKPIVSVRNLELNHNKPLLKTNRSLTKSGDVTSDRGMPSRDRVARLRHTHPPPTPPNSNKLLATVAKANQLPKY